MRIGEFQITNYPSKTWQAKALKVELESLASDESGRTEDGVMRIYWVKRNLRKLNITMPPMSQADLAILSNLVQGQEYYIKYQDPVTNLERTAHVYTSNSSADVYSGVVRNGLYQGYSFNAIELGD